jgi:FecR protein
MRLFRSAVILLGFASLLFAVPLRAGQEGYSYARIVRLSLVQGDVQISRSSSSDWENAIPNMPVQQGFTIGTNNGRAEIECESGAAVWIAENSEVQFTELALSDGGRITRLTLAQGAASFEVKLHSGDVFEVAANNLHVTVPEHSNFRVDASREGASVRVSQGTASVNDGSNTELIPRGQTYASRSGESAEPALAPSARADSWDSWVNERSGIMASGANETAQYTSAPVSYGMSDLAGYGNWFNCAGFGYGWQPWGMGANWAPFYDGYFDFYNGLGWTWISFEPWGWAPYHFGNWAYASGCGGWMWYPGGFGFWNSAPLIFIGTGKGGFGWRPNPVPWRNPREPLAKMTEQNGAGKVSATPIVLGARGGIGDGFPTSILAPGKEELLVETATPPAKNGKFSESEATKTNVKPPLAVPTAPNLGALSDGIAFDAANYRFIGAGGGGSGALADGAASGGLEKQPVLANGVREPKGVPHAPAPSGFVFSREAIARETAAAAGHSGFLGSIVHSGNAPAGGGFSHGGEAEHGGADSGSHGGADSGSHGGSASPAPSHTH